MMNTDTVIPSNNTADAASIAPAVASAKSVRRGGGRGIYSAIVVRALRRLRRGRLELTLPSGETIAIGDSAAEERAEIRITHDQFFEKCVLYGDIGFGEAFVDGDWETDDIAAVIRWLILNVENAPGMSGSRAGRGLVNLLAAANRLMHLMRPNSRKKSRDNIREHYDLSNGLYELFLDDSMTYSSGLFRARESLEEAQAAKYRRLCEQLQLKAGDHVLEIGCGWGGFCCFAAHHYGCRVTAVTISKAQLDYATRRVEREGLTDLITVELQDYRDLVGKFDKIVSIEMLEAVGDAYVDGYFEQCSKLLKPDGLLALQMITCPDGRYDSFRKGVDWIQKHIFPGSLLMSVGRVNQAVNRTGQFFLHDLKDMGASYARTLRHWRARFNARLDRVRELGFDDAFIRKWNYYLSYCEAAFDMRNISVTQVVFTRPNNLSLSERG